MTRGVGITNMVIIAFACLAFFAWGFHDGTKEGIKLAHAENNIRVSENDLIMQRVGICKWAKIMAEDHHCKTELP